MMRPSLAVPWCALARLAAPSQQGTRASAAATRASAAASSRRMPLLMVALQGEHYYMLSHAQSHVNCICSFVPETEQAACYS